MLAKLKYVYELCRRRQREGHLSVSRQVAEIAWLQLTRGVGYDIYHYAGMWDRRATWAYKRGYLSHRDFAKAVYQVNQRKFHGASQYKPLEKAYFRQFGIPTAEFIGVLHEAHGATADGANLRTAGELEACLAAAPGRKFCCKLVQGFNGRGFKAYEVVRQDRRVGARDLGSGQEISVEELHRLLLAESRDGWLLEQYIEQHPTLKAFNPTSVNTIRMFLYRRRTGEVVPLRSFLKTGRPGALIDKTEKGGASVNIDQHTGELTDGFDWSPKMIPLACHPATGVPFKGVRIPFWKEAEAIAVKALECFPGTRFVGVDIAITEAGPLMVEMNVHPDSDCMPVLKLPTRALFES